MGEDDDVLYCAGTSKKPGRKGIVLEELHVSTLWM